MRQLYVAACCFVTSAFLFLVRTTIPIDALSDQPFRSKSAAGKVEAAGIEPASAAAPAERLQA